MRYFYGLILFLININTAFAFYTNSPAQTGVYVPTIEQDPAAQSNPDLYNQQKPLNPPPQGTIITPQGPFKTETQPQGQTMSAFVPTTPGLNVTSPPNPPPPRPTIEPQKNFMQVPNPHQPTHEGFNPAIPAKTLSHLQQQPLE